MCFLCWYGEGQINKVGNNNMWTLNDYKCLEQSHLSLHINRHIKSELCYSLLLRDFASGFPMLKWLVTGREGVADSRGEEVLTSGAGVTEDPLAAIGGEISDKIYNVNRYGGASQA
jgi:hypothetical protein